MNKTVRSFSVVTGFAVVTRLIAFIFKIWVSRAFGAEVVGTYQIAMSVMTMLFTLTSGAPTVLSRKVAEATGDIKRQNSLATASLIIGTGISGALVALLFALKGKLGFLFPDERCLPIFLILLPTLVTSTAYASFRSWFWGRKNFLAFSSTELLDEVVKILLAAIFAGGVVSFVSGGEAIALAMTLSDALCVAVLAVMYFVSGGRLSKPSGFKELTLRTIPLSATRIITSVTASVTALALPNLLVKNGMSVSAATAEYGRIAGMAIPLIMAPVMLVSSLSVVLIPDVARLRAEGDPSAIRNKLRSAINFATLVACIFFALYLPLGRHVGRLLFGDEKAGELVSNCSFMLFFIVIASVTTPMLNSLGKERVTFFNSLLGAAALMPCTLLLPKFIGVYSMAVGSAACFLTISVLNLIALRRQTGDFLDAGKMAKCLAFSIPLALLGMFSDRLLTAVAGPIVSVAVVGAMTLFFLFIFIHAFKIADVYAAIRMLRPARVSGHKAKTSKPKKPRKRFKASAK